MNSIELTKAELNHLLSLIDRNKQTGTYYGTRQLYVNRSVQLRKKLELMVSWKHCFCVTLPKGEIAISSKVLTDPNWGDKK